MIRSVLALDVREGFRELAPWCVIAVAYALVLAFTLALASAARGADVPLTLGNLVASALGGMGRFLPSPSEPFELPVAWVVTLLLPAYATLGYPYRDLEGFGQKVLVASGARRHWWLSKCLWVTMCVLAYWCLFFGVAAVISTAVNGSLSLFVSADLPRVLGVDLFTSFDTQEFALFIVAVPLISVALCLGQLCVSLVLRSVLSFAVTFAVLFVSAFYYDNPLLIGNYLMAFRSHGLVVDGFQPMWGLMLAVFVSVASLVVGGLLFSRKDILGKGD